VAGSGTSALTPPALRPWQRLAVKLAAGFAALTVLTAGLVGAIVHERQKREVEDTVGTQLLNIARTGALLVDPALHAEVQRTLAKDSRAYTRLRKALAAVQAEVLLPTPIRTLSNYDPVKRRARLLVTSDGSGRGSRIRSLPSCSSRSAGPSRTVSRATRASTAPRAAPGSRRSRRSRTPAGGRRLC